MPATHPDLQRIWEDARAAIAGSDEVVFIGYSLPSYDSFAVEMLRTVCAGKQIIVYDLSEQTLGRFREIFPTAALKSGPFNTTPFAASG